MKHVIRILSLFAAALLVISCGTMSQGTSRSGGSFSGGNKTFTFYNLPETLSELQELPAANLKDPYGVAALTAAALCRYETNPEDCFAMLEWLKGSEGLTVNERMFLRDRLQGKGYKARSFFVGATPQNKYAPTEPYRIAPVSNSYSFRESGAATIYVRSSGAEDPRPIMLRKEKSSGKWFLHDIQCLGDDIRTPAN